MTNSYKKIISTIVFTIIGFLTMQIPATHLIGSSAKFTAFDCFGPIAGSFLGVIPGIISILLMQTINIIIHGKSLADIGEGVRLFPMLFAVNYFSKNTKTNILIPVIAIISFIINPIGRSVWYFSLFWAIPIVCNIFREKNLLIKSLGSTFTAHAVGGALWIWLVPLSKNTWINLIPVVIVERLIFTVGIAMAYVVMNNLLYYITSKNIFDLSFLTNENFVLSWTKKYTG